MRSMQVGVNIAGVCASWFESEESTELLLEGLQHSSKQDNLVHALTLHSKLLGFAPPAAALKAFFRFAP